MARTKFFQEMKCLCTRRDVTRQFSWAHYKITLPKVYGTKLSAAPLSVQSNHVVHHKTQNGSNIASRLIRIGYCVKLVLKNIPIQVNKHVRINIST